MQYGSFSGKLWAIEFNQNMLKVIFELPVFSTYFDLLRAIKSKWHFNVEGCHDDLSFAVIRRKVTEQFLRKLDFSEI